MSPCLQRGDLQKGVEPRHQSPYERRHGMFTAKVACHLFKVNSKGVKCFYWLHIHQESHLLLMQPKLI